MTMTKKLIVANWKCNPTSLKEAKQLFNSIKKRIKGIKKVEVVVCPPSPFILNLKPETLNLKLGAQDCFWEKEGAFTGEISPLMLKNLGIKYVILGHSERRKYLRETDEMINKKIKKALEFNLKPILCIGERKGQTFGILESQVKNGLKNISKKKIKNIIIAYEPIWAIGTGKFCSFDRVLSAALFVRKIIYKEYSKVLAKNLNILYGGSVNKENAKSYIKESGVNGLLVGGASLKPKEFLEILKSVSPAPLSNIKY